MMMVKHKLFFIFLLPFLFWKSKCNYLFINALYGVDKIKREIDPKYKKGFLLILTLILIIGLTPASAQYNGAKGVETTHKYIHIDSAKCSCIYSNGYHRHYNITWLNYCPICHRYSTLYFIQESSTNAISGFTSVEGMICCKHCDADFCLVHGTEHSVDPKGFLKHYIIKPKIEPKPEVQPEPKSEPTQTPKDKLQHILNNKELFKHLVFNFKFF